MNAQYTRNCPTCGTPITYSRKDGMIRATLMNRSCFNCSTPKGNNHYRFGKHCSEETKEKISISKLGVPVHTAEEKEKRRQKWLGNENPTKRIGHSPFLGMHHSEESKKRISLSRIGKNNGVVGKNHPLYGKKGELCRWFGKTHSLKTKEKLSKQKRGIPMSEDFRKRCSERQMGRKLADDTRRKMRISKINYIIKENGGICPMFNKDAINYFSALETKRNWNGHYAAKESGEYYLQELGYFVDYYEPNLNVVIEYDEPRHYYADGELRPRDKKRMKEIISHLHCKFYRYNESKQQLTEYFNDDTKTILPN
jgi:hypothetical protein